MLFSELKSSIRSFICHALSTLFYLRKTPLSNPFLQLIADEKPILENRFAIISCTTHVRRLDGVHERTAYSPF